MKYIRLTTTDAYYNLAVEEYLFSHTREDIFMLWQNSPTVVIGKNQNAYAEVDINYARANGINICRRITGGGTVYHDLGNINYSYITSSDRKLDFEYFSRPVISALKQIGVKCELGGRNDILADGKKISGNAQHSSNGRILHHGTLLFNTNTDEIELVLKVDKEKLEHHGIKSHKSRVANLIDILPEKMTLSQFISTLEEHIIKDMGVEKIEILENSEIDNLCQRNKSDEWIFSNKKFLTDYSLHKKKRYSFGSVAADLTLERDIIKKISITGDFFAISPINELEEKLVGISLREIRNLNVSEYIVGMSDSDLSDLLNT